MTEFVVQVTPEVPRTFHQLGVLVLDGSPSMTNQSTGGNISRADAVNIAVRELLTRLAASKNKNNFSIGIITFSNTTQTRLEPTPVTQVDDNADYNPLIAGGSGTHIGDALRAAREMTERFIASEKGSGVPVSAVIVLMSDGENTGGNDPRAEAATLKQHPDMTLCTTLFAGVTQDADAQRAQELLLGIATSPNHYKTVYDTDSLRKFFVASMQSVRNVPVG